MTTTVTTKTATYNAAFYGRYSDGPDQSESSITGQRWECYAKAKAQNAIIRKEYIDRHISGTTDKRPAFLELMKDAKKGLFDIIYVYTIDRFSRNKYDIAKYRNDLKRAGVKLISAKEFIPAGPEGIILESVLEGMAEYYSKELSRKVSRGIYESALNYNHIGGVVPFGFTLSDRKYVPHPINAPIVREIFERYAGGEPAVDICKSLNSRGILTAMGNLFKKNSLRAMLQNRKYIGTYSFHRKYLDDVTQQEKTEFLEFKNVIQPIVSEELFIKAGKRMELNKRTSKRSKEKQNVEFLLTGKLFCGKCESPYAGDSGTSHTGQTYYYYTCSNKKSKKGKKPCRSKSYPKEKLEQFITYVTKKDVLDEDVIQFITEKVMQLQNEKQDNITLLSLQQNKKDVERKISNIIKAIENGIFTDTTKEQLETLEQSKKDIEYNITVEQFKSEAPDITKDELIFYLNQFKEGAVNDIDCQRQIIDTFIDSIIINDDVIIVAYRYSDENNGIREYPIKNTFDRFECDELFGDGGSRTRVQNVLKRISTSVAAYYLE